MNNNKTHIPVMLDEVIQLLEIKPNGIYVDATLGSGGHSLAIIKKLEKGGMLISLDSDIDSILYKLGHIHEDGVIWRKVNSNFRNIIRVCENCSAPKVNGILADLGWSTDQLETIHGLSHEKEHMELDMRFDKNLGVKACDLLNALGKNELKKLFQKFSDYNGKKLNDFVETIIRERRLNKIVTVGDFNNLIRNHFKNPNVSEFSKIYQALRIAINDELNSLEEFLNDSFKILEDDCHLIVITFHSGEEKIVESFIKSNFENIDITTKTASKTWYWQPTVKELQKNLRARSAKLYGLKKISNL